MAGTPQCPPLQERYVREHGRTHLTGLQAIIRLPFDQIRRDRRDGRRTAALFSGYPGSPLAGLDLKLRGLRELMDRDDVQLVPGLNEELAASAVAGTQLVELFPHSKYDGVLGLWFGKAPGLDRSLDALRHANFTGTSRAGGALAVIGDDPFCKSSSLPSHSEHACAHAYMPLLVPADAAEVLRLGHHAIELSRYAGLWVGLRVVADVADGGAVFEVPAEATIERPKFEVLDRDFEPQLDTGLLPPQVLKIEEDLVFARLEAARQYAYANGLNPITSKHKRDQIGFVAAGALYRELETALMRLGLNENRRRELGIRVMKLDMVFPMEPRRLAEFADGLDEIVVVDTRRGFVEEQIRTSLFNEPEHPMVSGQRRENGEPWLARHDSMTAGTLALDLAQHLADRLDCTELLEMAAPIQRAQTRAEEAHAPSRAPHFCSGCPHSASTRNPEGSVVGGGIGCHSMALLMDRDVRYMGAMGSEGAHWIGLEPFVDTPHLFQNLGDGTYFHSGRQAIRACVEAGSTITYKLLYNRTVAMTGGQRAVGEKSIYHVVRDLLGDGVSHVVAMTDDATLSSMSEVNDRVEVVSREDWPRTMERVRTLSGVSVMIYDALCANQRQRLERRGVLVRADERIMINEDVCEGCGDCGVKSSCASLRPVATPLGRKTRVHQSSCSDDRSCVDGDCPAFMGVRAKRAPVPAFEDQLEGELPEPERAKLDSGRYELAMVGVGSTGVVTIDALLVRAAELDGLSALHLDQTGLAQRGGKVVSHLVVSADPELSGSPRVGWGAADTLLAFDPVGASDRHAIRVLDPERTRAVVHDYAAPTVAELSDPSATPHDPAADLAQIEAVAQSMTSIPAELLADSVLDEVLCANMILVGAALQLGLLPVSRASLEQAIRDNRASVELNLRALQLGRAVVAQPELARTLTEDATPPSVALVHPNAATHAARLLKSRWEPIPRACEAFSEGGSELETILANFALELRRYQSARYAGHFLRRIRAIAETEAAVDPGSTKLTETAARELYRFMAYKDEYEVARLLLHGPHRRWLERRSESAPKLSYHLHPPLLRALGMQERKLALGRWIEPLFHALHLVRRVRGTWLDPMRYVKARRLDRELRGWYASVLEQLGHVSGKQNLGEAIAIAALPEQIRGFEGLRAQSAEQVRPQVEKRLRVLLASCKQASAESVSTE